MLPPIHDLLRSYPIPVDVQAHLASNATRAAVSLASNPTISDAAWQTFAGVELTAELRYALLSNPALGRCALTDAQVRDLIVDEHDHGALSSLHEHLCVALYLRPAIAAQVLDSDETGPVFFAAISQPGVAVDDPRIEDRLDAAHAHAHAVTGAFRFAVPWAVSSSRSLMNGPVWARSAGELASRDLAGRRTLAAQFRAAKAWARKASDPRAALALADLTHNPNLSVAQQAKLPQLLEGVRSPITWVLRHPDLSGCGPYTRAALDTLLDGLGDVGDWDLALSLGDGGFRGTTEDLLEAVRVLRA